MLTLAQLYDLAQSVNVDMFEGLTLPEGSPLDRNTLINSIMIRCGLNFPNFADPYVMTSAITVWSAKHQYTFEHIAKIYEASYSPIENYDRFEENSQEHTRELSDITDTVSEKTENTKVNNNTDTTNNDTVIHSGVDATTNEQTTSAYNASNYQPEDRTLTSMKHGETVTDVASGNTKVNGTSDKDSTGSTNSDKKVTESEKTLDNNHIHGNIGIKTATATQVEEYEFLSSYNPYNFIAEIFENELTLFVY